MARATTPISAQITSRHNHLDLLRILAGLALIFSHFYALRDGSNAAEPFFRLSGYCNLGKPALYVLFFISGLLAGRSFQRDPRPARYLWNRALRLMPGLWVCLAFCILVVGPLLTRLPLGQYFTDRETLRFSLNGVLLPNHYFLPGISEQYPHDDPRAAINGSLWSVPLGALMFVAVAVLGAMRLLSRRAVTWIVTLVCLLIWLAYDFGILAQTPGTLLYKHRIWVEFVPHLGFFFFSGVLAYLYRDRIKLNGPALIACLLAIGLTFKQTWTRLHLPVPTLWQA